jgi:hypothetical protein
MICNNCGCEVNGEYCNNCGARVDYNAELNVDNSVNAEIVTPAKDPGKGLGIASLVLGIVAIAFGTICSCLAACLGGFLPLVCGIVGIVLGVLANKKSKQAGFNNKLAKIGMILSIVACALIVLFIILNGILGGLSAIMQQSQY